jgi:hypothetical protein
MLNLTKMVELLTYSVKTRTHEPGKGAGYIFSTIFAASNES